MENQSETLNSAAAPVEPVSPEPTTPSRTVVTASDHASEPPAETAPVDPSSQEGIAPAAAPEGETPPLTAPGAPPVPRTMEEIEKSFTELCNVAGEAFFQREFHDFNLKQMLQQHRHLTSEGRERMKIDEKLKDDALKAAEAKRARKAPVKAQDLEVGNAGGTAAPEASDAKAQG